MKPTVKATAYGIVIGICATSLFTVNCAVSAKSGDYRSSEPWFEEIVERSTEVPETSQIESERAYEQTASEEKERCFRIDVVYTGTTVCKEYEEVIVVPFTEQAETEAVTYADEAKVDETYETKQNKDSYLGKCIDAGTYLGISVEITEYLYAKLAEQGIAWWTPYALAQIFQESRGNPRAENRNGLDKGLLQYRITYWNFDTMGDIFDYKAQINRYALQTANRLRAGCSIEETISRHMMSDWGEFNAKYVSDVMRWYREVE